MTPLLKWVGSKRWHVPLIKQLWRPEQRLVELFCGSCAITFGLNPERALLNDANPHLINFYSWVQHGLELDLELTSSEGLYYDYRFWFNRLIRDRQAHTEEAAQLFYYLNHHGFSGLCRFNAKGEFNVPFGPGRKCEAFDAQAYQRITQPWHFTCEDFREVLLYPGDFVYADPPYEDTFGAYTAGGWTFENTLDLAVLLRGHTGPVVLMNSATPRVLELYQSLGYFITELRSGQAIHRGQGQTDQIPEIMATNWRVDTRDSIDLTRE